MEGKSLCEWFTWEVATGRSFTAFATWTKAVLQGEGDIWGVFWGSIATVIRCNRLYGIKSEADGIGGRERRGAGEQGEQGDTEELWDRHRVFGVQGQLFTIHSFNGNNSAHGRC